MDSLDPAGLSLPGAWTFVADSDEDDTVRKPWGMQITCATARWLEAGQRLRFHTSWSLAEAFATSHCLSTVEPRAEALL